jgi:hypothetical protein
MTTVVNNTTPAAAPATASSSDGQGSGFLIGVLVLIGFLAVALYFGIPALRSLGPLEVNVPTPQINVAAPQVVVPDKVNVEVTPAK